ncbi:cytochrome d ubiquinol oxidase subunit II [Streptomyces hainanensis]|uniref:Cytochrome d ubiquinol oxidase subunit II n=1 Tax=Streptomyces hainanensis TaxID=402648 RepID=A0A4R4TLL6_9ACTN|nr:cytochrome d ubiquinol oxidase subunit II [Streptomyces hainanensis]TDC76674.1 cytochrome d ubiquinol oxidase subunit II [Streptomyces hainanensis]
METLAALVLGVFVAGYFVLAGADIGLGMLLPALGRGRSERGAVIAAVGPLFMANEVWLVAAAGVLFGCFPALEGELFSGLLPVLVPLLAGWLLRDAGLWWRRVSDARALDALVVGGSWLLAGAWGWLLASLLVAADGVGYAPAPVATGAITAAGTAALFAAHGLALGCRRLTGEPLRRAWQLTDGRSAGSTRALTSAVMAGLPLLAGARLPLTEHAASSTALLVQLPPIIAVLPLLVAARYWLGRAAQRPPSRAPIHRSNSPEENLT